MYLRAQARSFSTLLQQLRPVPKEGGEEATKVEKNVKMNTIKWRDLWWKVVRNLCWRHSLPSPSWCRSWNEEGQDGGGHDEAQLNHAEARRELQHQAQGVPGVPALMKEEFQSQLDDNQEEKQIKTWEGRTASLPRIQGKNLVQQLPRLRRMMCKWTQYS